VLAEANGPKKESAMFWIITSLVLVAFSTIAFAGIADARTRFRRFEQEMEAVFPKVNHQPGMGEVLPDEFASEQTDTREAAHFTPSLLSVMQAHSAASHHSPETVSEESKVSAE
jgi:hypothetical protein